ncbi:MAG TPA: tetratricopeptide repeat protein, partial [Chloroflexota bacterium]
LVAGGPVIAELLEDAPEAQVLATSREPLRVYGERELPVGPLTLADPGAGTTAAAVAGSEAVRLFVTRARDRKPDFALTDQNAAAVAEICARLDGLPLAIELAAARVHLLPPAALLARLERRLALLVDGPRDLPARQQTLRGALDWSHDLLDPTEQRLFRRLAVFDGGWTIEAAERVIGDGDWIVGPAEVLEGLASLASKSLLAVDERDNQPRFRMLGTVREYARERLVEAGEEPAVGWRHAEHFAALAEEAEPQLRGSRQADWLRRLLLEHENLIAAMRWALESGQVEPGLRIAGALRWFWDGRGGAGIARPLIVALLARPEAAAPTAPRAAALNTLGILAADAGEYGQAESFFEQSLAIWRRLDDRPQIGYLTNNLGALAQRRADYATARRLLEESLAIKRVAADRRSVAGTLQNIGIVETLQGDYPAARRALEESLAELRATDDRWGIANALLYLAWVDLELGELARARAQLGESLRIWLDLGHTPGTALALGGCAAAAVVAGQPELALRLGGAAAALCAASEQPLPAASQEQLDRWLARARAQVDPAAAAAAWAAGLATSPADAIELAGTSPAAAGSDAQRSC